ncbi:MAG: hypothetical protein HUU16_16595, partial [Candidatus Omnitrophica bacterium]|nr:hypothetical protein [Candidatus Omnitrophota bacterium]
YDYFHLLLDLFIERWAKPYYDECARNRLNFTGHYWEHEWPRPASVPDNMAMAAWQQMPGIDCLMNQYNEGVHAQFGNVRAVREVASVANQLGRARRLCEVYGAGGWEMTFEDQKRIADWLGVLGIDFFDQHLTYMTLRGPRKRDHPLSFSDHEPWWEHYSAMGEYLARLSLALSSGGERNRILVLEPTTSGWVLHRSQGDNSELDRLGEEFQAFLTELSLHQVEYDLGCEQVIRDHGKVEAKGFRVGERVYDLVVLHHTCTNLGAGTFGLLKQFATNGGNVLLVGGRPKWVEGAESDELSALFPEPKEGEAIPLVPVAGVHGVIQGQDKIREYLAGYSSIRFEQHQGGKLFHQFRQTDFGGLLFLCNTSKEESASGKWLTAGKQVRLLNLLSGKALPCSWVTRDKQAEVAFELPPAGSALYLITNQEAVSPKAPAEPKTDPATLTLVRIERNGPNVLPLDYCDYEIDGNGEKDVYFYRAQTAIYKARGFDKNPWDNAVQFEDRVLSRDAEFKEGSGFNVRYHFTVKGFETPPALQLAVEQAHLYEFTLNGKPLQPNGKWWLDRKFELLDCGDAVAAGVNELVLTSKKFSVHCEVEPVYLLGEFSLESCDKGWVVRPANSPDMGSWKDQGMPFYGGGVRYVYLAESNPGSSALKVLLPKWEGVVAVVEGGGNSELIAWPPYEATLGAGMEFSIEVIGSLKNTLGPHHGNPSLGTAWPGQFQKGPESGPPKGSEYHTIPYGLMEPPRAVWVQ